MRTTLDIDDIVLRELKELQESEKKPLGRLVSELVAKALSERHVRSETPAFEWISKPMNARLDLGDKAGISAILDAEDFTP